MSRHQNATTSAHRANPVFNQASPVAAPPLLASVINSIEVLCQDIGTLTDRANGLANRVYGPWPDEPEKSTALCADNLNDQVRHMLDRAHDGMRAACMAMDRLELIG